MVECPWPTFARPSKGCPMHSLRYYSCAAISIKKNFYTSSVLRCSAYLWKSLFIGMFQETNQEAFLREVEGGFNVMGGWNTHLRWLPCDGPSCSRWRLSLAWLYRCLDAGVIWKHPKVEYVSRNGLIFAQSGVYWQVLLLVRWVRRTNGFFNNICQGPNFLQVIFVMKGQEWIELKVTEYCSMILPSSAFQMALSSW